MAELKPIMKLTKKVDSLAENVGGLSDTIGYGLEDRSYNAMIDIIKKDFGVDVEKTYRKNIVYSSNKFDEINIYGKAERDGKPVYIIGECKARFGPKNLEKYLF